MLRTALPAVILAAVAAVVAVPATALAAGEGPAAGVCPLEQTGIVGGRLTVGVTIAEAGSTAARKSTCSQVAKVVAGLVEAGAERPMRVNRYRCTPSLTGRKVSWECIFRGGRPRTKVTLSFAYRYAR